MYIMPFSPSSPVPPKIRPKSYPCPVAECTKLFTCERGIRDHLSLYKERFQDYAYRALEEQFAFCSDPPETKETEITPVKKAPRESGRESFNYLSAHYEAWKNKYGMYYFCSLVFLCFSIHCFIYNLSSATGGVSYCVDENVGLISC